MSSLMTPASDAGSNKKQVALTPEQAKNRLVVMKQGNMSVQQYFEECHRLCNIIRGEAVDVRTNITLLAAFQNGLKDNIRRIFDLAPITDAVTARMVASQEEMFTSFAKLRDRDGQEDRIHKMELLHFMGWEKMRSFEQKFLHLNEELKTVRLENKSLKEVVDTLTEAQKEERETATDHFTKLLAEIKAVGDAVAAANAPKENVEKIEMVEIRNTLESIGKRVDMNYDWILAIHRGLDEATKKPETPISIPTATPPPLFPTKRSHSHSSSVDSDEDDEDEDNVPSFEFKRARTMTATEEAVLEEMKEVLSEIDLEALYNENVTDGITKLYEEYSSRTDQARRWMSPVKIVDKRCCLCKTRRHHAHDCDQVRTVEERKRVMRRDPAFCMECTNIHGGECNGIKHDCWLCIKAKAAGRFLPSGAGHARMWCPLQEQFFKDKDITNKLFKAKKLLSESA